MTADSPQQPQGRDWALAGILIVLAAYAASFAWGLPQRWTAAATAGHAAEDEHAGSAPAAQRDELAAKAAHEAGAPPPLWTITPFVLLLAAIATFPLVHFTEHWWE